MKQGDNRSKKLGKSTVAFSGASDVLEHTVAQGSEIESEEQTVSRSDQPLAKSGLRKRSPIGVGRMVERLGSYVVEKRLAASEGSELYRCVHALTGVSVIAKVLRIKDGYNERMHFDTQLASLETGKLEGVRFISRGKCAVGPYFLVEDSGDDVIDRLIA